MRGAGRSTKRALETGEVGRPCSQGPGALLSLSLGDRWPGLEHILGLTSQPGLHSELTVDLRDVGNHSLRVRYASFRVDQGDRFYWLCLSACTQGRR